MSDFNFPTAGFTTADFPRAGFPRADDDLHPPPPPTLPRRARGAVPHDGARPRTLAPRGAGPRGAAVRGVPRQAPPRDAAIPDDVTHDVTHDDADDGLWLGHGENDIVEVAEDGWDAADDCGGADAEGHRAGDSRGGASGRGGAPPGELLRAMTRVRPEESHADGLIEESHERDRARVLLSPGHAMAIILILTTALCASLTLLVIQGLNITRAGAVEQVAQAGTGDGARQGAGTRSGTGESEAASSDGQSDTARQGAGTGTAAGQSQEGNSQTQEGGAQSPEAGDVDQEQTGGQAQGGAQTPAPAQPSPDDGLIDINTAAAAELDEIKGVGPATAEKIIALREQRGGFSSVDELLDVPGIGPRTLEKMRPQITVRTGGSAGGATRAGGATGGTTGGGAS